MKTFLTIRVVARLALLAVALLGATPGRAGEMMIGVAKVDITPETNIRLSGYGGRRLESEGVAQRLWGKALAIGEGSEASVILTVDNLAVPMWITDAVAEHLRTHFGVSRDNVALCTSHTHSAPCLADVAPNIFATDIPADHQEHIRDYTLQLVVKLQQAAGEAMKDRKPGNLFWGEGQARFAANRRTAGGPVDHAMPILCVKSPEGKVRAVLANYACHCTTLGGEYNKVCGDWAGFAQEAMQEDWPGAIAMMAIGCGADANPQPRGGADGGFNFAKLHGKAIAAEVKLLLANALIPLNTPPIGKLKRFDLAFDPHFTREQWEERAKQNGIVGYHAKKNLARLDRGETLPTTLPYSAQSWVFGTNMAMVFLPGEVVVDYALRLKKEFDATRLWVNGYANDVPCYIPSRRILKEGGYEAEDSLWYYDRPARLAASNEDTIIGAVHEIIPAGFRQEKDQLEFPAAKSPKESLGAIRTKPGFTVELVAAEPLIVDPVAIDWGLDGRLWVAEMHDYPTGIDRNWKPGGRVKVLEDTQGSGRYDKATLFLDGLPFPTGVMAWKKGVLICAAPDIIYAEDTDGDGKADKVEKLFSGFYTDNYQARVNSLSYGLDNWVYGANGLLGGTIRGRMNGREINIQGQDFRMRPETGEFEPASGLTQQGRVRDDWGNWFGCDNGTLIRFYPLPDHYLRRNQHVASPSPSLFVPVDADPNKLYPSSRTLTRYNDPQAANRTTSACGLGIYRDDLLGADFTGNAFTCEPVHNLVHRLKLTRNGIGFEGRKPADEEQIEFLSSKDNWFRPVQARTGPDGALWIVDMYRYLIEHPRWVPAETLAKIDVRAGDDMGRIYRVYPTGKAPRPIPNLAKADANALAAALETPNGTVRDMVQMTLVERKEVAAIPALAELAKSSPRPETRVQALACLDGLKGVSAGHVKAALQDSDAEVRRHGVRLAEPFLGAEEGVKAELFRLVLGDQDLSVRYQLALSLGETDDRRAGAALFSLAHYNPSNVYIRSAVLSSATKCAGGILASLLKENDSQLEIIKPLIATALGSNDENNLEQVIRAVAPGAGQQPTVDQLNLTATLLDALAKARAKGNTGKGKEAPAPLPEQLNPVVESARQILAASGSDEGLKAAALGILGWGIGPSEKDLSLLQKALNFPTSLAVQEAALAALARNPSPSTAAFLLEGWSRRPVSLRAKIIQTLLNRPDWGAQLAEAVASGVVSPAEISLADRQRLAKHSDPAVRERAKAIFATATTGSRAEAVQRYKAALAMKGHAADGAEVFGKNCASCHALKGIGFEVGPNLAALASKDGDYLLQNILDPNAVIEPRFVNYQVETKDQRSLSGVVGSETSTSLVLAQANGVTERVLRSEIVSMRASSVSLMPEGIEQNMSLQDAADLLAFLKERPSRFGGAAPETAAQARRDFVARHGSGMGKVTFASEDLLYPGWLGRLHLMHCRQTDGSSRVTWTTAPLTRELAGNKTQAYTVPAAVGLISQPAGQFTLRLNGKALLDFNVTLEDRTWWSADGKVMLRYNVIENNEEDSNGRLTLEIPTGLLEVGKPATIEVAGSAANSMRWFGVYKVEAQ